jgi:DNA-binding MarR family transcriptional regulator
MRKAIDWRSLDLSPKEIADLLDRVYLDGMGPKQGLVVTLYKRPGMTTSNLSGLLDTKYSTVYNHRFKLKKAGD